MIYMEAETGIRLCIAVAPCKSVYELSCSPGTVTVAARRPLAMLFDKLTEFETGDGFRAP